jgi:lysophospholipid acyltransferase (LPLAT)-like uncharacterized protein
VQRNKIKVKLIGFFGSLILRVIKQSLRWKKIGFDQENSEWPYHEPRIIAFWHSDLLLMPWIYLDCLKPNLSNPKEFVALISAHGDGQMISETISYLKVGTEVGSSSKNGSGAILRIVKREAKKPFHVAITPDGPRGPRNKSKEGVIKIAELTGMPIYPVSVIADKAIRFKSWDEMFLPVPFSRVRMIMGEPLRVPKGLKNEERTKLALLLDERLNSLKK